MAGIVIKKIVLQPLSFTSHSKLLTTTTNVVLHYQVPLPESNYTTQYYHRVILTLPNTTESYYAIQHHYRVELHYPRPLSSRTTPTSTTTRDVLHYPAPLPWSSSLSTLTIASINILFEHYSFYYLYTVKTSSNSLSNHDLIFQQRCYCNVLAKLLLI